MRSQTVLGVVGTGILLGLAAGAPGCGGGGGGGGGGVGCFIPGSLAALALEGGAAPGVGGTFGAFGTSAMVAVADGGWTVFVADVVGGSATKGLFAARPDGSLRLVYAKGDLLPDSTPGTGTIDDFQRIFVTPAGAVVAVVSGTNPTFGIVAARIDGTGAVVEKHGAIYAGDVLPTSHSTSPPGTLTAIDDDHVEVSDQGEAFFLGTGSALLHGVWSVDRMGINVTPWVATLDAIVTGGTAGATFDGFGLENDGAIVAFAVNVIGAPSGRGIFATDTVSFVTVARDGDTAPNTASRPFIDAYAGGPIAVSFASGVGFVTWTGQLAGGSPDLGVFTRQVAPSPGLLLTIVAPGVVPTGIGGAFSDSILLDAEHDPNRVTIQSLVAGGTTNRVWFASAGAGSLLQVFRKGEAAPGGGTFGDVYPSLATLHVQHADNVGSMAFTATVSDGTTGVYWALSDCDFFAVAKDGSPAPGTFAGTFSSFGGPAVVTTATGVVVFRAAVTGGSNPSGLFRQF